MMKDIRRAGLGLAIGMMVAGAHAAQARAKEPAADPATATLRQKADRAIDSAIEEHRLVGAVVLISRDGKLVYQKAAGFADREHKRPMKLDTVFRFSSVTKPIVSAAALALVDRGTLKLDDPVTKYLPAFRPRLASGEAPPITIRQRSRTPPASTTRFRKRRVAPITRPASPTASMTCASAWTRT